jgi:hypothetical protein
MFVRTGKHKKNKKTFGFMMFFSKINIKLKKRFKSL